MQPAAERDAGPAKGSGLPQLRPGNPIFQNHDLLHRGDVVPDGFFKSLYKPIRRIQYNRYIPAELHRFKIKHAYRFSSRSLSVEPYLFYKKISGHGERRILMPGAFNHDRKELPGRLLIAVVYRY